MASLVNPELTNDFYITNQTVQEIFTGRTTLSKNQRDFVRTIIFFSLFLCVVGLVLLGITVSLSDTGLNSKLVDPDYIVISSLRFPCLILAASVLYFAKITTTYFKKTNETEVSPELVEEIEKLVKESIQMSLQRN